MSDFIILKGINGFGFHGVLDSERKEGQNFIVDVELKANLANLEDKLENTIDYSALAIKVKNEIESPAVNLIETLAERIASRILNDYERADMVIVTVHKPNAPMPFSISDLFVTITRTR